MPTVIITIFVLPLALAFGCHRQPVSDSVEVVDNGASAEADVGVSVDGAPERLACEVDADCRVSCAEPGDCCGPLCYCDSVTSQEYAAWARAHNRDNCTEEDYICRVADCEESEFDYGAACVNNQCTLTAEPR